MRTLDVFVRGRGLRLLIGLFCVALVGLVMADDASGYGADLAVPRQVACDTPDDGAFDAPIRPGCGGKAMPRMTVPSNSGFMAGPPKNRSLQ